MPHGVAGPGFLHPYSVEGHAMPRDRFLSMVLTHVEGLTFEVWNREKEERGWTGEQKAAVSQYIASFVQRVLLLDPQPDAGSVARSEVIPFPQTQTVPLPPLQAETV